MVTAGEQEAKKSTTIKKIVKFFIGFSFWIKKTV
jgi:hypothetical protein